MVIISWRINLMKSVVEFLEKFYKQEQYNHPIQTRPKPEPGITGEKPKDIEYTEIGDEGGTTSMSSKRVNKSRNRIFKDEEDYEDKEEAEDE
jgi:hypothetical protein